jgi:mono/diheme cytochrome c family protein
MRIKASAENQQSKSRVMDSRLRQIAACVLLLVVAGCEAEPPQFRLNLQGRDPAIFQYTGEEDQDQQAEHNDLALQAISTNLWALFGTPDEPHVLEMTGLNRDLIELASGPAFGDRDGNQRGLYRQHCAHCHGISGDGNGPTAAFLDPTPRDYRQGIFKFKSTERAAKPTRADLKRVLVDGITGTAMPSFALLPDREVDALVEYVMYLSMRGQAEQFMDIILFDDGDELGTTQEEIVDATLLPVVTQWQEAESQIIVPPDPPAITTDEELAASIAKGKELFAGQTAQCAQCHGPTALGDGSQEGGLYDDWNKPKQADQLRIEIGKLESQELSEEDEERLSGLQEKLAIQDMLWDFPQQQITPRNLRLGIYRFGRRPADLFRRIYAGINGTPMPAAGASPTNTKGLSSDEIWHIVNYVRSLPYEPQSELFGPQPPQTPAEFGEGHTSSAHPSGGD